MTRRNKLAETKKNQHGKKGIKKIACMKKKIYNSYNENLFHLNRDYIKEDMQNFRYRRKRKKESDILEDKESVIKGGNFIMNDILNQKDKYQYNKDQNNSYKKIKRLSDYGIYKHYSKKKGISSFFNYKYDRRYIYEKDKNVLINYIEYLKGIYLHKNSNYDDIIEDIKKNSHYFSILEKMNDTNSYNEKYLLNIIKSQFINNSLIKLFNNIGREIVYLIHLMKPTYNEILMRKQILKNIEIFIKKVYPTFFMFVFGSCNTDLDIYNSDIDICIYNECECNKDNIRKLYRQIRKDKFFKNATFKKILNARVPIVKCYFEKVQLSIDISFNQLSALTSTIKIQDFLKNNSLIKYLIIFFKIFLSQHDLNDASKGGISSFNVLLILNKFLNENEFVFYKKNTFLYIGEVVHKFITHISLFKDKSKLLLFLNNSEEYDFSKLDFFNKKSYSFFKRNFYLSDLFDDVFGKIEIINPLEDEQLRTLTFNKIFKVRICFKDALFSLFSIFLRYVKRYGKDYYLKYNNIFKSYSESISFLNYLGDYYINESLKKYYKFFHCNIHNFDKLSENQENYSNDELPVKESKNSSSSLKCNNNKDNSSSSSSSINNDNISNSHTCLDNDNDNNNSNNNNNNNDHKNKEDRNKFKNENLNNSYCSSNKLSKNLISFFQKIFKEDMNVNDSSKDKGEINEQCKSTKNGKIIKKDCINIIKYKNSKEHNGNQNDTTYEKKINKHKERIDKKITEVDAINICNSEVQKKTNFSLKSNKENLNNIIIYKDRMDTSPNEFENSKHNLSDENISNNKNYSHNSVSNKKNIKSINKIDNLRKNIEYYNPDKLKRKITNIYKLYDSASENENEYIINICKNFRELGCILNINKLIADRFNYYSVFKNEVKDTKNLFINDNKLIEKLKKDMLINLLNMKNYDPKDLLHLEINNDVFINGYITDANDTYIDIT